MKKFMIIALTAVLSVMSANAQDKCCANGNGCCWSPYWYVQAQGGLEYPLTNAKFDEFFDLTQPAFGLNIGRQVTPLVGVRLGVEGWNAKVVSELDAAVVNKYKYYTTSFDATLNLVNLFSKKPCHPINVYALAGVGYNWSEATLTSSTWFAPSCRVGAILEANLSKNVSLSLEQRFTNTSTQWDGNIGGKNQHDWYGTTMLGIAYKFGHKKVKHVVEALPEVWETKVDTIYYDETEYKTKTVSEQFTCDDHFKIRESAPVSESVINKVTDFVKKYNNVKVFVTGYADKGTGNPTVNMKYSQQRAESVANALVEAGVPADIITVDWKGDTVQPFAENDKNRAAIVVVSGETEQKYPVTVKKTRTEEKRVRIQ